MSNRLKKKFTIAVMDCCPGTKCGELHPESESGNFSYRFITIVGEAL